MMTLQTRMQERKPETIMSNLTGKICNRNTFLFTGIIFKVTQRRENR